VISFYGFGVRLSGFGFWFSEIEVLASGLLLIISGSGFSDYTFMTAHNLGGLPQDRCSLPESAQHWQQAFLAERAPPDEWFRVHGYVSRFRVYSIEIQSL
jgi:hypothetical protein